MKRTNRTLPILLSAYWLSLCLAATPAAKANESFTTDPYGWTVTNEGALSFHAWPIQDVLTYSLRISPSNKNTPTSSTDPSRSFPELRYRSDSIKNMIGMSDGIQTFGIIQRSYRFDAERHAVRILDTFINNSGTDQSLDIIYTVNWKEELARKIDKPQRLSLIDHKETESEPQALIFPPSTPAKTPASMFILGAQPAHWPRSLTVVADAFAWTYTGTLAPNQRIVLCHWIAILDDAQPATVRKKTDSLIAKGMPADDSFNRQVFQELINYPIGAAPPAATDADAPTGDLFFVKALCKELAIEPSPDHDLLALKNGPILTGEFKAGQLRLKTSDTEQELPLDTIAAIQGGAGIGRRTRVFLRDGTVTSGTLTWKDGTFTDDRLGAVKLTADTLDTLILLSQDASPSKPFAALVLAANDDVIPLPQLPQQPVTMRWIGGSLDIPWNQITTLRRMPFPALEHEVSLKDGSRIQVWLSSSSTTPSKIAYSAAYATTWPGFTALLEDKIAAAKITGPGLQTTDGSRIAGVWASDHLLINNAGTELKVPVEEIRSLIIKRENNDSPFTVEIQTSAASTLKGRPVLGMLSWKWNGKTLSVPWSQIAQISATESTAPPAPAKP